MAGFDYMNMLNLSATQLRRAATIKDQIEKLERQLGGILGAVAPTAGTADGPRRKISAAGRARIAAAARKRWASVKGRKKTKRKMSAAAKAKLSAKMKEAWARRKAAAKK